MKNILVTGANGFFGLRVCQMLGKQGYHVRALIRRKEAARCLEGVAEISIVRAPWLDDTLRPVLRNIDAIIHAAGRAQIADGTPGDADAIFKKDNVDTTRELLAAASATGVERFLLASSIMAMGSTSENILTENDVCRPATAYGRSKLAAEDVVRDFSAQKTMKCAIIRFPLIYGPGNRENMLKLFMLVSRGVPVPLASVSNRRSFIYVDNAVEAARAVLECPHAAGEVFLASDGEDVSVPRLVAGIATALRCPCRLVPFPPRALRLAGMLGNGLGTVLGRELGINTAAMTRLIGSLAVDSSKIRRVTGWKPRYSLDEGLEITGRWFLEHAKV